MRQDPQHSQEPQANDSGIVRHTVRIPIPPSDQSPAAPPSLRGNRSGDTPVSRRERQRMMEEVRRGTGGARGVPGPPRRRPLLSGAGLRRVLGWSLLAAFATLVGMFFVTARNISGKAGVSSLIGSIANPRGRFPGKNRITVLLIGKDYNRVYSRDPRINGMPTSKDARSDSIMLATLDLENKKATLLSIPRDTYVRAPDGKIGKINGTFARGGEELLSQTVRQLLGVTPDYYVSVRIPGVAAVVDAVNGVEVETIDAMKYDDEWGGLHVDLPKGRQVINGKEAIGFARFREADIYQRNPDGTAKRDRYGNPLVKRRGEIIHSKEEGDPRRMARQQQLIKAIVHKAKSMENLLQLDTIVEVALGQIDTNMDRMQIFALAALFRSIQPEQIQSGTVPGEGRKRGSWYFFPDKDKTALMVDWLVHGNEQAGYALTVVEVQNATGTSGAARSLVSRLRDAGFDAQNGGNASSEETESLPGEPGVTRIVYTRAANLPRAQHIQGLLGGGTVVKDTRPDTTGVLRSSDAQPDIRVVLDEDLAETLTEVPSRRQGG